MQTNFPRRRREIGLGRLPRTRATDRVFLSVSLSLVAPYVSKEQHRRELHELIIHGGVHTCCKVLYCC